MAIQVAIQEFHLRTLLANSRAANFKINGETTDRYIDKENLTFSFLPRGSCYGITKYIQNIRFSTFAANKNLIELLLYLAV